LSDAEAFLKGAILAALVEHAGTLALTPEKADPVVDTLFAAVMSADVRWARMLWEAEVATRGRFTFRREPS
jgi:hypothetical protein